MEPPVFSIRPSVVERTFNEKGAMTFSSNNSALLAVERDEVSPLSCPICGNCEVAHLLQGPDRFHRRETIYELVRCSSCSLVWLKKPPTPDEMPYHYGVDYHRIVETSGESDLVKRWRIPRASVLALGKRGDLLDIGCSTGAFLYTLKDEGWQLHGIEISPEEARKAELRSGARVFVGDILDAPFAPQSFDVITGLHVLEHVDRLDQTVRRLWEWLKPDGVLYLNIPNIDAFESRIFKSYWFGLELPRHLFHFSTESLRRLFLPRGFEEVKLSTLPDCFVEKSIRYVVDDLKAKCGLLPVPLAAETRIPSIPWRLARKMFRLGILWPFRRWTALTGRGASIEAVFRKRVTK